MKKQLNQINKQIESNKGKNIFLEESEKTLFFIDETIKAISDINELDADSIEILIHYTTEKAMEEFCRMNQYYSFNAQAKDDLKEIYSDLFTNIKSNSHTLESIEKSHYQNLKRWLNKTNPFSEKIYSDSKTETLPVACSEYMANFQIEILKIDTATLMEPILDIGCGKQGNLLKHLSNLGFVAKGIDRFSFSEENLIQSDWLEFHYGEEKWGTIVSHLGFSNHFKHHNLREDGNYLEYAKVYMKILKSLKVGGKFHYAPDLHFIEQYLDLQQYKIEKHEIGDYGFKTSIIKRLKI